MGCLDILLLFENIDNKTLQELSKCYQKLFCLVTIVIKSIVDQLWTIIKISPIVASRYTTKQAKCLDLPG